MSDPLGKTTGIDVCKQSVQWLRKVKHKQSNVTKVAEEI